MNETKRPTRRNQLVFSMFVVGATLLAGYLVTARFKSNTERTNNAEQLHMLGLSILIYVDTHGGAYPDSLVTLSHDTKSLPGNLWAVGTGDTPATGLTTQAVDAELVRPGHVSFRYVGRGFGRGVPDNAVVAFEPLSNHGDGSSVLFADGHAEFVDKATAARIESEANSGESPIFCDPK